MLKQALMHFSKVVAEPLDELWSVASGDALLNSNANEIESLLDRYSDLMLRIGTAAADWKLDGLQSFSMRVIENLQAFQREKRAINHTESDLLSALAELLLAYVMSEGDRQSGEALVRHLTQVGWACTLNEADASALRNMLVEIPAQPEDQAASVAETFQATSEPASAPEPLPPLNVQKVDGGMLVIDDAHLLETDGEYREKLQPFLDECELVEDQLFWSKP